MNPLARAVLKAAEYLLPHEAPSEEYPFSLITGRTLFHFHTRTKTGRAPQLQAAAPEVWVEMSAGDATEQGIGEGDLVEVASPRGAIRAKVRVSSIRDSVLFIPFHYGYGTPAGRAARGPIATGRRTSSPSPTGTLRPSSPSSRPPRPGSAGSGPGTAVRPRPRPTPAPGRSRRTCRPPAVAPPRRWRNSSTPRRPEDSDEARPGDS